MGVFLLDDQEKLFDKTIEKLRILFDDPNMRCDIKENIKGEMVIFYTNSDRYELLDLEEDPNEK